jgi:hypothetical protein
VVGPETLAHDLVVAKSDEPLQCRSQNRERDKNRNQLPSFLVEDYCARDQGKENEQQIFPETEMMFLVVSLGSAEWSLTAAISKKTPTTKTAKKISKFVELVMP